MDGYEAARHIRRALGRRIVLVALTGWGQEEDKARARDAGFDHHLTKPAEPEMLERLITDCGDRRVV
jgi:CheY-like chemotaxis protein